MYLNTLSPGLFLTPPSHYSYIVWCKVFLCSPCHWVGLWQMTDYSTFNQQNVEAKLTTASSIFCVAFARRLWHSNSILSLLRISHNRMPTVTELDSGWTKHPMVKSCSSLTPWTPSVSKGPTELACGPTEIWHPTDSRWRNMVSGGSHSLGNVIQTEEVR